MSQQLKEQQDKNIKHLTSKNNLKILNFSPEKIFKDDLFNKNYELVKKIAYHLKGRLPDSVLVEDLIQSGVIGLLEAVNNYNVHEGASFDTFAGIRIRGAMIDDLRKSDWTPRSVNKNSRLISNTISLLESKLGREPNVNELANHLGITINEYHTMVNDVNSSKMFSIDEMIDSDDPISLFSSFDNPQDLFEKECFNNSLIEAIKSLPEKELQVVSLYYDEELNLKEIGLILNVSEGRVSQILKVAINKIKLKI